MTEYRRKFHRIARRLTNLELQQGAGTEPFSLEGILEDLQESRGSELLLGSYSKAGILRAFDKFGIQRVLSKQGFSDIKLTLNTSDQYHQMLRLYYQDTTPDHLLGELVVRKAKYTSGHSRVLPARFYPLEMIQIEWLILQNPTGTFDPERPPLPGQEYPGLGIGKQVLELLYLMAKHQRTQGLLIVPHYYHTALIFSREFHFINPAYQALLNRMEAELKQYSLTVRAWGVECGAVFHKHDNTLFRWAPEEQILACDHNLRRHFHSPAYQRKVGKSESRFAFYLDTALLQKQLPPYISLAGNHDAKFTEVTG